MNKNWQKDKRLRHWLTGRPQNTLNIYLKAFRLWSAFRGMSADELIQEKWKDMKKPPMDQGLVEDKLKEFYMWLTKEYEVEKRGTVIKGKKRGKTGKVGLALGSASTYCAAITDFYSKHNLRLNIKLAKAFKGGQAVRPINETEKMSAEQIEELAYYAPALRDKAVIWTEFQSGSDISTICSLNWGHVAREIDNPPLGAVKLKGLIRKKEPSKTYISFIYKTAIEAIRAYLRERWGADYAKKLQYDTPLFLGVGRWKNQRIKPRVIEDMMRELALKAPILPSGRVEASDINPLRPHALRASFSDRMAKAGANKLLVDYFQGHKMPYNDAYFGGEDGLREAYVKYAEVVLEPRQAKQTEEIEQKFDARIGEQDTIISSLVKRNRELEERLNRLDVFVKKWVKTAMLKEDIRELDEPQPDIDLPPISREEMRKIVKRVREKRTSKPSSPYSPKARHDR